MRPETFVSKDSGHLTRTIEGEYAFVPAPLPPAIDLGEIAVSMAEATQAIGELKGACRRLASPYILIRPLQRQEALTSSAMEGTFTSADNLVLAEAGLEKEGDDSTREVVNYLRALNQALGMLRKYPISHRVIKAAHETLLSGLSAARGAQKRPGEYKKEQNWIGGRTIQVARFVPPPPADALECMDMLEKYINREKAEFPTALIDLALVHYQIETIHPFADGNGRVGRMLISLMSVQSGLLEMPVLYISPAMERDKDKYIDLMFNVSAKGEWTPWLKFFFSKVCEACQETVATIDRLIGLQESYRQRAGEAMRSANIVALVDMLFEVPAISVSDAQNKLDLTYAGARKSINKLTELGILVEISDSYPKTFLAPEIVRAARPPDRVEA